MASPPAIALTCRDGGAWHAAGAGLQGLSVAAVLAWAVSPWAAPTGLLWAWFCWRRVAAPAPHLAWDGCAWALDETPGQPLIVLDTGVWMLLAFDASGHTARPRRRWMALSPEAGRAAWPALRAALYFSASSPAERPPEPAVESRAP